MAFSNHVLVFMLRGIKKKWKQPIAYYFFNGTTKTNCLVMCIKQVISSFLTTSFQIIATVCDQGATIFAAIRKLKEETNIYCLNNNIENQYLGFLIEGFEVVPVFNPPHHLLKCIKNNMLTKMFNLFIGVRVIQCRGNMLKLFKSLIKKNEVHGPWFIIFTNIKRSAHL